MKEIYILYYEYIPEGDKQYRGKTLQCDDLRDLIFNLRECENNNYKRVQVTTLEGRSQE